MSDKPKVYQGVRVKTTVKELLQRHRAREASSKKVKTISQSCSDLQDFCGSMFATHSVDPLPAAAPPTGASSLDARALQLRSASFPDSSCAIQMQTQQHFGDVMLPSNGYSGNNHNSNNNNNNHHSCGSFSAPLHAAPTFPLPLSHGLSSDADYYGQHEMAPCSSPESLKLCSPMDHNSYSPQDSFSSSSSSCYDSPTRMESSFYGVASEHYSYQHCSLQDCYCLPHWPGQQESFSAPEYAPYYSPTDYPYSYPVEENYFRRDLQMSSEMCYNVL